MSNIEERVIKMVAEQLGVKEEDVKSTSSFVEDLGADSLDTVELIMALEAIVTSLAKDVAYLLRLKKYSKEL